MQIYLKYSLNIYDKKTSSYTESSSYISSKIPLNFTSFTEETIITRNNKITELLNKYTNY